MEENKETTGDGSKEQFLDDIFTRVANSKATIKSQQRGDPELTFQEKKTIAGETFDRNTCSFLMKFGKHLTEEQLDYIGKMFEGDYQVDYHIKSLKRYLDDATRQIDVKNRRFQALESLIRSTDYFSEVEMMKRNPLLYEHLVGRYLTEEQKKSRDNIDTKNITFVNLLLEGIERDRVKKLKADQQEAEDNTVEEFDSDSNNDNDSDNDSDDEDAEIDKRQINSQGCQRKGKSLPPKWGESFEKPQDIEMDRDQQGVYRIPIKISMKERAMLKQEFVSSMYQNFLDGKDVEYFDYSTVDDNETYDNVNLRTQDEEEKYFDSESPETVLSQCHTEEKIDDESEDELDVYMKNLTKSADDLNMSINLKEDFEE